MRVLTSVEEKEKLGRGLLVGNSDIQETGVAGGGR